MSGMRMRPISSTSRKPRVVIRPVLAPLRCRMVLEPTVVPCSTSAMAPGAIDNSASSCPTPSITAMLGSAGVEEILLWWIRPASVNSAISVKVPPISTATRYLSSETPAAIRIPLPY